MKMMLREKGFIFKIVKIIPILWINQSKLEKLINNRLNLIFELLFRQKILKKINNLYNIII